MMTFENVQNAVRLMVTQRGWEPLGDDGVIARRNPDRGYRVQVRVPGDPPKSSRRFDIPEMPTMRPEDLVDHIASELDRIDAQIKRDREAQQKWRPTDE